VEARGCDWLAGVQAEQAACDGCAGRVGAAGQVDGALVAADADDEHCQEDGKDEGCGEDQAGQDENH